MYVVWRNALFSFGKRRKNSSWYDQCVVLWLHIQAAVISQDAKLVAKILSLGARNGGIARFGNLQTDILPLPTTRSSKVRCPDGVTRTRGDRLDSLPDIPTDEREKEITSALIVAGILGFCGTVNALGIDDISPVTNLVRFKWPSLHFICCNWTDHGHFRLRFGSSFLQSERSTTFMTLSSLPWRILHKTRWEIYHRSCHFP